MDKIRDEKIPEYLKKLEAEKVLFPKITLTRYGDNNLALRAKSQIQDGDIVLSVPLDLLLNNVTLRSRIWPALKDFDPRTYGCDKWALTYLFIATEYCKGESSPYWTYLSMLPRIIDTPVSYPTDILDMIASTNLHKAVTGIREKLRGIQRMYREVLRPRYPDIFTSELKSDEEEYAELLWAYEAFWSRAFAVMIRDPYDPEWEENTPVASLVPLCGMLNHSPDAHVTYITDVKNGVFCIQSNMTVEPGDQFYNNYRNRSNEKMLLNYGFFTVDNPLDTFTIKVNAHPGMDPLYKRKRALLAASGIAWEHYLTKDPKAPVPSSLLNCLRVLSMSESELYFCGPGYASTVKSESSDPSGDELGTMISLRNEAEALRTLSVLLDKQLERLRYPDFEADFERIKTIDTSKSENYPLYAALYYRAWQAKILTQSAQYARNRYASMMKSLSWVPRFVAAPECTSPDALNAFNAYAEGANVFRGVRYALEEGGRGVRLVATRPLTRGEPIVAVPAADLVGADTAALREALGDDVRSIASRVDSVTDPNAFETLTSLFLIASLTGKLVDSKVRPLVSHFLRTIPRAVVSPVFLSPDTIENSLGELPLVDDTLGFREQIMAEHQTVAASKRVKRSGVATKDYVWARVSLEPRIVDVPAPEAQGEGRCMAMMPLPFLPRYSPYHRLERRYDAAEGAYVVYAGYDLAEGEEVFDNVGYDQPGDHLLRFGTLLATNPLAIHRIDFEWGDGEEDVMDSVKMDLLKRLNLSAEGNLLTKGQFPYPLLHTLRVLNMTDEEITNVLAMLDKVDKKQSAMTKMEVVAQDVSDETEVAALAMLKEILMSALDALPQISDPESAQGGNSHDFTGALTSYIAQQRSIVTYTLDRLTEIGGDKLKDAENENDEVDNDGDSVMSKND